LKVEMLITEIKEIIELESGKELKVQKTSGNNLLIAVGWNPERN